MTRFWRGVAAGVAFLAVSGAGSRAGIGLFLPELVALRLFERMPMAAFDAFVRRLGPWSPWIGFCATAGLVLLGAGLLGLVAAQLPKQWSPLARGAACALGIVAVVGFVLYPLLGAGTPGWGMLPAATAYAAAFEATEGPGLRWAARRLIRRRP